MSDDPSKISVLVWAPVEQDSRERAGLPNFRVSSETLLKPVRVDADQIAENLQNLIKIIEPALQTPSESSGLTVDEVELKLMVSATGEVGFVASASAGVEASITVRLKRH